MRTEQNQMSNVIKRVEDANQSCLFLGEAIDEQNRSSLQANLISYLQQKNAAGVVTTDKFSIHVFPHSNYTKDILEKNDHGVVLKWPDFSSTILIIIL